MTVDIDKLRELAQAASQEKWEFWHGEVVHSVDNDGAVMVARRPEYSGGKRQKHHDANMQYIAAVNPQTILALLDELDRLRDSIKKQASSAIMGMDAAKSAGLQMWEAAKKLHAESSPEIIESERSANALFTEENERLQAECERLQDQIRQHEAFQQFANATEEQRMNDARREGFKRAQEWAARICWKHDNDAKLNATALGWSGSPAEAIDCIPLIKTMQLPAEWTSSEQCGVAPNIADIDVRPQVQAFIEATRDVVSEHSEELSKHTVYAGNRFKQGCGKELADGQWWRFCGETDMGQTLPAICTECGGTYKLAESEWPHADGFGGGLMGGKE